MKLLKYAVHYSFIILFLSGCATLYGNNNHEVLIDSFPHGAQVFINNVDYGKTPISIILINLNSKIILKKQGYNDYIITINSYFQKIAYWNILFPLFFFVDWDLGNSRSISVNSKYYNIYLNKNNFEKI